MVVAAANADYVFTAAGAPTNLAVSTHLHPPARHMPQVVYLGDEAGEVETLEALSSGRLDALDRGKVGNRATSRGSGETLVATALYESVQDDGYTLAAKDK